MRDTFVRVLEEIAASDANVILITGDLGFGVLMDFAAKYPQQFINAGVAEQNMTSLAVGMALEGKIVFTYSIANFPTLRCLEQIRNDALYHDANVKIVSVGGGLGYGSLGMSHHATEDLGIMRILPRMSIYAPGDVVEAELATRLVYATPGTCYLRLGFNGGKRIHPKMPEMRKGKAIPVVSNGHQVAFISTGAMLGEVLEAADLLKNRGIEADVYSMPCLSPVDQDLITDLASRTKLMVTVEDHQENGGLGGAVAEVIGELQRRTSTLMRIGLKGFTSVVGDQQFLRKTYGLSADCIAQRVEERLLGVLSN